MSWIAPLLGLLGGFGEQNANKGAQASQQAAAQQAQQQQLAQAMQGVTGMLQSPLGRGPLAGIGKIGGFQGPQANPNTSQTLGGGIMGQGGMMAQGPQPQQAPGGGLPPQMMQMLMQFLTHAGGAGNANAGHPPMHYPGGGPPQQQNPQPVGGQPPQMHYPGGGPPGASNPGGFRPFPISQLGQQLAQNYQPQQGPPKVSLG